MDNVTIGQILAVGATLMALGGFITWLMKPVKTLDNRLSTIEKRLDAIDEHLDNDNRRLSNSEEYEKIMTKAILSLIEHSIDGNHTSDLKIRKEEVKQYLINR